MNIFQIFNKNSVETIKAKFAAMHDSEATLSGLNLKQLMEAHSKLRSQLQDIIDGSSDQYFDVVEISEDCHCYLGKWIYGAGKIYSHMPEYESLRHAHASFHECAGNVLTQHILGNSEESEHLLKTKYRSASNRNQLELVKLFAAVKS